MCEVVDLFVVVGGHNVVDIMVVAGGIYLHM
jgi:hypothetical protein